MTPIVIFKITELNSLQIVVDNQNKVNIYGYETDGLHAFDEVEVRSIQNGRTIILAKDTVQHVVTSFAVTLEKVLKNNLLLPESFSVGNVGYFFSKKTYIGTDTPGKEDIFSQYWVWSSPGNIQTWLYNRDDRAYLEISQTYPWLFSDPQEGEAYFSFDEYANNYMPIVLVELEKSLVQEWINQCHDILQRMEAA